MIVRRSFVPLVLAVAALGCAARQHQSPTSAVRTPAEEIRRVATAIETEHVVSVDAGRLLRTAAQAIDAEAGTVGPGGAARDGQDPPALLDAALARFRAARPEAADALAIGIAVKAMVRSLADRSRYIEAEEIRRNYRLPDPPPEVRGAVGLAVKKHDPYPLVLRVLPASPAAAARIEAGLELRAVDGHATSGLQLDETARLLVGPPGSEARLALGRPGEAERIVVITRAEVDVGAIDCRILDGRVLYLGVRYLGGTTVTRLRRFAQAVGRPAGRVILDLRGNQGGPLQEVCSLADEFLDSGPILSVQERHPKPLRTEQARAGSWPLKRARVAVLVDGETASGAEAVAAALQDNRRGAVIGTRTAGSASIDTLLEIGGGGVLRLTVGYLLRASGEPIDGRGVSPDVPIDAAAPAPASPLPDKACPGLASPAPVARDPVVARAAAFLLAP